jgi:hypothetical protein
MLVVGIMSSTTALVRAMLALEKEKRTGVVTITTDGAVTFVYLREGIPVFAEEGSCGETLGRLLVRERKLTQTQYVEIIGLMTDAFVLNEQLRFGEVAIELGYLMESEVCKALGDQIRWKIVRAFQRPEATWQFEDSLSRLEEVGNFPMHVEALLLEMLRWVDDDTKMDLGLHAALDQSLRIPPNVGQHLAERFELSRAEAAFAIQVDGTRSTRALLASASAANVDVHALLTAFLVSRVAMPVASAQHAAVPASRKGLILGPRLPRTDDDDDAPLAAARATPRAGLVKRIAPVVRPAAPSAEPLRPAQEPTAPVQVPPRAADVTPLQPRPIRTPATESAPIGAPPAHTARAPHAAPPRQADAAPVTPRAAPLAHVDPAPLPMVARRAQAPAHPVARAPVVEPKPAANVPTVDVPPVPPSSSAASARRGQAPISRTSKIMKALDGQRVKADPQRNPMSDQEAKLLAERALQQGLEHMRAGRYAPAAEEITRAAALLPQSNECRVYSKWCTLRARGELPHTTDLVELRRFAMASLTTDPNFAFGHYVLGDMALNEGRDKEALRFLKRATKLDSNLLDAQRLLRMLERRLGPSA